MVDIASLIIGGALTLAGAVGVEKFRRHEECRGVASAIAGEISAILYGAEKRGQVPSFTSLAQALRSQNPPRRPWVWIDKEVAPAPILDAHIQKIGALGCDLPERVARFYTILQMMQMDLKRLLGTEFEGRPDDAADLIEADLKIWAEAVSEGTKLVEDLKAVARRRFSF